MGWWSEHAVPRITDRALNTGPVHKLRSQVCAGLSGQVVEIGFGSGLNAAHYPEAVASVDAVEPSGVGWALAADRVAALTIPVRRAGLDGQLIEAPPASYDSALSTFTLCTISDAAAALAEVRRVLRPGGSFHFLEHGLSSDDGVAVWQRRLNPLQKRFAGGCHLDRPIAELVEAAGFQIESMTADYLPGPRPSHAFGYVYLGRAHA